MSLLNQWREEIGRHTHVPLSEVISYYGDERRSKSKYVVRWVMGEVVGVFVLFFQSTGRCIVRWVW
jgi:hypothetical protein